MRRQFRLRRRSDFDAIFEKGRAWNNNLLVLRVLPNNLTLNRYGFVTSRRLGKAVVRNKVRRRLREIVRTLPVKTGVDVVISAKTAAAQADFQQLKRAVVDLLKRANLLAEDTSMETGEA
jgi:ribonuclease P protein component